MRRKGIGLFVLLVISTTGCFHQIVNTGRPPGPTVVNKPWVSTFIFGLVAATPIDVRAQCPSGVAIVETQQSFVNGLVMGITFGLYTPQSVKVTCASGEEHFPSGTAQIVISPNSSASEQSQAFQRAARQSSETHRRVIVRF